MPPDDLVITTPDGLYCPRGGFHIDPWRPVPHAIITHAHSDHAGWGCKRYLASPTGAIVLRQRVGPDAGITPQPFNRGLTLGDVAVSLHPAGHILGSAQVRIEHAGRVCVISGDYKSAPDATCEPFEPVRCHTFITESTFGLPVYRWRPQSETFDDINRWWRANQADSRTSIVFAYALGKAQRMLAGLDPAIGPIACHGAVDRLNRAYRDAGIALPDAPLATADNAPDLRGRGLIVAPPSAASTPWLRKFAAAPAAGVATAFASGWMLIRGTRRRRGVDRGFALSDHADWSGLLDAIRATGASRIGVTHGYVQPLVRYLREHLALDAFAVPTRYEGERFEDAPDGTPSDPAADPGEAGESTP